MRTALTHTVAPSTMRKTVSAATSVGFRRRSIIVGERGLRELEVEDRGEVGLHRGGVGAEGVEEVLHAGGVLPEVILEGGLREPAARRSHCVDRPADLVGDGLGADRD